MKKKMFTAILLAAAFVLLFGSCATAKVKLDGDSFATVNSARKLNYFFGDSWEKVGL